MNTNAQQNCMENGKQIFTAMINELFGADNFFCSALICMAKLFTICLISSNVHFISQVFRVGRESRNKKL
jgi:branched-subunit amino acid permease